MPGTPFDTLTSIANTTQDALGLGNNSSSGIEGTSIVMEEQNVDSPRRIVLQGRAMPYQGVPWGGTQAAKTTWYPGNPTATVQVLGPRENDTPMEGMWKDRFMRGAVVVSEIGGSAGGGGAVAQAAVGAVSDLTGSGEYDLAQDVVKLFHGLRRAGTILRVQWLGEVRYGFLQEFEADYDRAQDISWSMNFEWISWDDLETTRSATLPEESSALLDRLDKVVQAVSLAPSVASAVQATLVQAVDDIADTTGVLFNALETIDTIVDTPGAVLGAMLNNVRALDRQLTDIIRQLVDVRWPNTASATALSGPTTDPLGSSRTRSSAVKQELEFERWRKTVSTAAQQLRRVSADAVDQRLARLNPRTTRIVQVQQGTTLYDLSRRFYGSPDFASFLAGANGLSGARVEPGTTVRVPPRPTGPVSRNIGLTGRRKTTECGEC